MTDDHLMKIKDQMIARAKERDEAEQARDAAIQELKDGVADALRRIEELEARLRGDRG